MSLAPIAAANLHQNSLQIFKIDSGMSSRQPRSELSVWYSALETDRLDNQNRYCKLGLILPLRGIFHIDLTTHVSSDTIWCWLRAVHDCHVLQSRSLHDSIEDFNTNGKIKIINESDKGDAGDRDE